MPTPRFEIDARIAAFASTVDDVVTATQLRSLGAGAHTIRQLLRAGWLHRLGERGTYVVGSGTLTPRGRVRAAVLATGSTSHVGGVGTLFLFDIVPYVPKVIDVVTTCAVRSTAAGVRVLRSSSLPAEDRAVRHGIRTTSVERAIVDLSRTTEPHGLLKHMRCASFHHQLDVDRLRGVVDRRKHAGDCVNIRRALQWHDMGDGGTDSALERCFLRLARGSGCRRPRSNVRMPELQARERVDFVWDEERVVVEVDGPHHLDVLVRAEDARRDRSLHAGGWTVLRFWWWEIEEQPADVTRRLREALHRFTAPTLSLPVCRSTPR